MNPTVELIYDADCPNVERVREALRAGFTEAGLEPVWTEWDRANPDIPDHAKPYGSPTVLVGGWDVGGAEPQEGSASCRVYTDETGRIQGAPSVSCIASTLLENGSAGNHEYRRGRLRPVTALFAAVPGVGIGGLPILACPACWPAYSGILGALGLGFLIDRTILLPLTVAFFGLALFALAFRAKKRRGYGPFLVGLVAVALVLVFKFAANVPVLMIAGLGGLIAAAFWNVWPKKGSEGETCACCAPEPATSER